MTLMLSSPIDINPEPSITPAESPSAQLIATVTGGVVGAVVAVLLLSDLVMLPRFLKMQAVTMTTKKSPFQRRR